MKHPELADRIRDVFPAMLAMEQPGVGATLDFEPHTERIGETIGRYKLLERIGEGGFGVVFMAEQQQPVRRKVAVKILKPGMDSRQVLARFAAERQALALMDHPNIARVLDAGATNTGRPYFVMELDQGRSYHRVLRSASALSPRASGAVRTRLPRRPARAPKGDHSPRHQAVERARDDARHDAGGEGDRLWRGQGAGPGTHR